jgi:aminoglycoside phosphotransferase (APT) family kinase protein
MELRAFALGEEALRRAWPVREDWRWDIKVLQWREEERLIADCALRQRDRQRPAQRVIAKWYGDTMGGATFALMQALDEQLQANPDSILAAPRPLFYDGASQMLVQQMAQGKPYQELLTHPRYRHYLREVGRALAVLHRLPGVGDVPGKRVADHMLELMRPNPLVLAEAVRSQRARIEALAAEMLRIEDGWRGAWPKAWLHRDFHVGQLFYGGGRVWVIDWDLAAYGDPALDVGNFLQNLIKYMGRAAPPARDAFIAGYLEEGEAATIARAPLYEGLNNLRRACKAYRTQPPGWRTDVAKFLDAGEQCLARL